MDPLGLMDCGAPGGSGSPEYTHIAIDKNGAGLDQIRLSLNAKGLQTAASRGIKLAKGGEDAGHHEHVFMWDSGAKGIKGGAKIVQWNAKDSSVLVKIRSGDLKEPTWYSQGTLKGDNKTGLGGPSENGAWAYKGDIPRKYLFIDGIDQANQPGFEDWLAGKGWPDDHAGLAETRFGYEEIP
jgi:hypothetical protein